VRIIQKKETVTVPYVDFNGKEVDASFLYEVMDELEVGITDRLDEELRAVLLKNKVIKTEKNKIKPDEKFDRLKYRLEWLFYED